jgi:hypothetical protein
LIISVNGIDDEIYLSSVVPPDAGACFHRMLGLLKRCAPLLTPRCCLTLYCTIR